MSLAFDRAVWARQVHRAVVDGPDLRLMLAAVEPGAGVTTTLAALRPRLAPAVQVLDAEALASAEPPTDGRVLFEGPALCDPARWAQVPPAWWAAADGALLLVMGRRTRRADVQAAVAALAAHDVPLRGVLHNTWATRGGWARLRAAWSARLTLRRAAHERP